MTDDDDPRMQGTGGVSGDTVRDVDREGFIPIPFKQIVMEWEALKVEAASLRERLAEAERDREVMHAALRLAAAERDTLRAERDEARRWIAVTECSRKRKRYIDHDPAGSTFEYVDCGKCPSCEARRALGTGTRPYCRRLGVWIDHIRTTDPAHEGCHILDHPYHYRPPSGGTGTQDEEEG